MSMYGWSVALAALFLCKNNLKVVDPVKGALFQDSNTVCPPDSSVYITPVFVLDTLAPLEWLLAAVVPSNPLVTVKEVD